MHHILSMNNRQLNSWRLFIFAAVLAVAVLKPTISAAHQTPNTLIFLDASPNRVALELQMPLSELELAFGNDISKSPETLIQRFGPQLKEYLQAHIHAYLEKTTPWEVEIEALRMDKGKYIENGIDYWEIIASVVIIPQPGESTRKFMLDYDVIMHQVINHAALISIRSDWETGNLNSPTADAMVISRNTRDNVIYPLEINLLPGSWFKGFKSMLALGMQHIKEGTDHLLFLIVLLLPATLLIKGRQWGKFGGTKYSILRLLKIVTSFTIGHSITLLIGALGWLRLPAQPVEILIAFSIFVSAIHAIKPIFPGKEIYVAAGFGLIHGLAFASILANLKLGAGTMGLSILGFNLGIEIMQLFVVLVTIPWLILISQTPLYQYVRVGGAIISGIIAIAWILERATQTPNFVSAFVNKMAERAHWAIVILAALALISILLKKRVSHSPGLNA
jgi:hypothetical protein